MSLVAEINAEVVGHVAAYSVSISDGVGRLALDWGRFCVTLAAAASRNWQSPHGSCNAGASGAGRRGLCASRGSQVLSAVRISWEQPDIRLPDVPPEYFLVMPFDAALPHGIVAYHAGFSARGE